MGTIDSNGFVHFLVYAEASDGVTSSTIETDYVELEVTLKSTANLIQRPIFKRTANFEGKVAGSTVENPHIFKADGNVELASPDANRYEATNVDLNEVKSLDGVVRNVNRTENGLIPQQLFSFNVVAEIERKLGEIPASDKVQWCKDNVNMRFTWSGKGSSPIGNNAHLDFWYTDTSEWYSSKYGGKIRTHSNSSITTLSFGADLLAKIDSNGFTHFLAYTEASDGTVPSSIVTDYVELEIELKPDADLIHPNVPLYQVTQSEYDQILVDWDEQEVMKRYPSVTGMQHVQNPMLTVEGKNLLPPFYEWFSLHSESSIKSPYELEMDYTGSDGNQINNVIVPVSPNKEYTLSFEEINGYYQIKALDGNKSIISVLDSGLELTQTVTTTEDTRFLEILVYGVSAQSGATLIYKNPMLNLGSQPKPFTPYNPSHLYAQAKLGAIGDVKDTLYQDQGQWKLRKVVEKIDLGKLEWSPYQEKDGFALVLQDGASDNVLENHYPLVEKYNGKILSYGSTSGGNGWTMPDSSNINGMGQLAITISYEDATGYDIATSAGIKQYFVDNPYKISYIHKEPETLDVVDVYGSPMASHTHIKYSQQLGKLGEYENGITEEGTFSSIIKVEKIDRETGAETNVTDSCTLNPDKNGFTSTALKNSDLVWYELEVENAAGGTLDFMYYDSRYVIEDDSNGKVYKYKITASDGVPQIKLVEI
ncbi:hypothetical protein VKA52_02720 [Halobacillus sp. HZG1]|uniref:hypothetical protein n=1 Tax=Halobacillus sp. HZG1 TaxID=3111769 RepID=UPI002DBBE416|nr:hypothetical protein [Halobacillus sp. HZG1]MEC3882638.1 hypothetical protein [Halobacillus sp. HZG1]